MRISTAAILLVCLAPTCAFADDNDRVSYLHCVYTDPANQRDGRFVVLTIDLQAGVIRMDDNYVSGTTSRQFGITGASDTSIEGTEAGPKPEVIKIDRVSGRVNVSADATADADRLWNDEKQQIGGFALAPGKKLWLTFPMDCKPAKPVL